MSAPLPQALRQRIAAAFQKDGSSTRELAKRFCVSQPTVVRILQRLKHTGSVAPRPHGGGRKPDLSEQERRRVEKLAKDHPQLTGEEIAQKLRRGNKKAPGKWTIWRALGSLGMSRKRAAVEASEKHRRDVKARRKQFQKVAKKLDPARLVFLDETGVNGFLRHPTGWAVSGDRAVLRNPLVSARKNRTVIGAVRASGLVAMRSMRGGMKKAQFLDFVVKVLAPRLNQGDSLVMDNLASHHSQEAAAHLQSRGVKVIFLPPYSPDRNPIEMLWSILKRRLAKMLPQAACQIARAVRTVWRSLSRLNFAKFLPPCGYRNPILPIGS